MLLRGCDHSQPCQVEVEGGGYGIAELSRNGRIEPAITESFVGSLDFKGHFTHRCSMQAHSKLSMIGQPELIQCDFIAKCIDQSAVVQEFGCSERPPRGFFRFDETATFSASSCKCS